MDGAPLMETTLEQAEGVELTPKQVMEIIKKHFTSKELCIQAYCSFLDESGGHENETHSAVELLEFLGY